MEKKEDIFKHGLKGGYQEPPAKEIHVEKTIKRVFDIIKKLYKPLFLIIMICTVFYVGYSIKKCPECEVCEECEVCVSCPEFDCSICPKETEKVTLVRYACSNGLVVDDLKNCNPLNHIKITSPYKETDNSVMLSIDKIEFVNQGDYSKITEIDYTIINFGKHEIKPVILVNIYSLDDERSERGLVHEVFDDEEYIGSNEWVIKKKNTNIGYNGERMVIRLVMKDLLPDPDKELVRVSRPLEI